MEEDDDEPFRHWSSRRIGGTSQRWTLMECKDWGSIVRLHSLMGEEWTRTSSSFWNGLACASCNEI